MINVALLVLVLSVFNVSCTEKKGDVYPRNFDIEEVDGGSLLIKFDKNNKKYTVEYDPENKIKFVNLDGVCSDHMLRDVLKVIGKFNLDSNFIFIRVVNAEVENVSFLQGCNATLLSYENCVFSNKFSFNNFRSVGNISMEGCDLNEFNIFDIPVNMLLELSIYNSRGVAADIDLNNRIAMKKLSIVNCGLSRLPKNIHNIKGLRMLVLSFNNMVDTLNVCAFKDLELLGIDCVGDDFYLKTNCESKAKIKRFNSNQCDRSKSINYDDWVNSVTAHRYSLQGDIVF